MRACPEEEKKEVPSEAPKVVRNPQSEYKPSSNSVASGVPNLYQENSKLPKSKFAKEPKVIDEAPEVDELKSQPSRVSEQNEESKQEVPKQPEVKKVNQLLAHPEPGTPKFAQGPADDERAQMQDVQQKVKQSKSKSKFA